MNTTDSAQLNLFIQKITWPFPLWGCWLEIITPQFRY